jgi:hypothetical protein
MKPRLEIAVGHKEAELRLGEDRMEDLAVLARRRPVGQDAERADVEAGDLAGQFVADRQADLPPCTRPMLREKNGRPLFFLRRRCRLSTRDGKSLVHDLSNDESDTGHPCAEVHPCNSVWT